MFAAQASRPQVRQQARQLWLSLLCALCLLAGQGLGHWHRVAHATPLLQLSSAGGELSSSWGHQAGDAFCLVFDHLAQDAMPQAMALALPASPALLACPQLQPPSAAMAAFWKRGPRGPPFSA